MERRGTILYVGNFAFPCGNASGKRVYANGKALRDLGFDVVYVGMDRDTSPRDLLIDTKRSYDGFVHYSFSYPRSSLEWLRYECLFQQLAELLTAENLFEKLQMVIYYGSPRISLFCTRLIRYCRENGLKIVSDCVDWLSARTGNAVFDVVKWADTTYQKAYANRRADGIIAVSSYLHQYYGTRGRPVVTIPPLAPTTPAVLDDRDEAPMKKSMILAYAGIPCRLGRPIKDYRALKDRMDRTIELLYLVKRRGCSFRFNVFGFTKDEYLRTVPGQRECVEALGPDIVFHGMVPNEIVLNEIAKSDFTILIRDVNRDAMAGFPTKVSESITCGTPVITTRTSDLEVYLEDGVTGFFLANDLEQDVPKLERILTLPLPRIGEMKRNCAQSRVFSYSRYTDRLERFVSMLE